MGEALSFPIHSEASDLGVKAFSSFTFKAPDLCHFFRAVVVVSVVVVSVVVRSNRFALVF